MNTSMSKPLFQIGLISALVVVLSACLTPSPPTPSTSNNEIQDVRVRTVEPTRTITHSEEFQLPNCGGTDRLVHTLGTYASANKSAVVSERATLSGGGEIGIPAAIKLRLEIQVEQAYQQTFESANMRLDSIVMAAARESHVTYIVVWEEQTYASAVQYSVNNMVYEAPYTYKLRVPKLDDSYEVSCLSSPSVTPLTPSPPVEPPEIDSKPTLPANVISLGSQLFGRNNTQQTGTQKYGHFISGKIKYTRISVDDDISKVEIVCTDTVVDITDSFFSIAAPSDDIFPNYGSQEVDVPNNCRIDFTVVDTGGGTGITVYAEVVSR